MFAAYQSLPEWLLPCRVVIVLNINVLQTNADKIGNPQMYDRVHGSGGAGPAQNGNTSTTAAPQHQQPPQQQGGYGGPPPQQQYGGGPPNGGYGGPPAGPPAGGYGGAGAPPGGPYGGPPHNQGGLCRSLWVHCCMPARKT